MSDEREWRQVLAFLLALTGGLSICTANAHPLGNNTVNRQARLQISDGKVQLRYLMDLAEIPTLLEAQKADEDRDGTVSQLEWAAYAKQWAERLTSQLHVELDRRPIALQLQSQHLWVLPGAADLTTLRLEADYTAILSGYDKAAVLHYRDGYKPELSGWKEVWISAGNGVTVMRSSASQRDRSSGLTRYDTNLASLPDELTVDTVLAFATPAAQAPAAAEQGLPHETQSNTVTSPAEQLSAAPTSQLQQAWVFFRLGVHHIATGWDHLVFLLGLLLLVKSLRQIVKTVTAFTIAHSITLALAANHWVTPPGSWVEPGIALTIAYVGLLNLVWRNSRHGAWLAFGFGLVHGFGFAGALAQTLAEQHLAGNHWLLSLLSFNLGIEAFQLLLVALIVPVLRWAASRAWFRAAHQAASLCVLSAGVFWFLLRTIA
jgi:hydrogenase/urease accessory protein HupE